MPSETPSCAHRHHGRNRQGARPAPNGVLEIFLPKGAPALVQSMYQRAAAVAEFGSSESI